MVMWYNSQGAGWWWVDDGGGGRMEDPDSGFPDPDPAETGWTGRVWPPLETRGSSRVRGYIRVVCVWRAAGGFVWPSSEGFPCLGGNSMQ